MIIKQFCWWFSILTQSYYAKSSFSFWFNFLLLKGFTFLLHTGKFFWHIKKILVIKNLKVISTWPLSHNGLLQSEEGLQLIAYHLTKRFSIIQRKVKTFTIFFCFTPSKKFFSHCFWQYHLFALKLHHMRGLDSQL